METFEALKLVATDEANTAMFILCQDPKRYFPSLHLWNWNARSHQCFMLPFGQVAVIFAITACTWFILAIAVCAFVTSAEWYALLDCLHGVVSLKVSSAKYMATYHWSKTIIADTERQGGKELGIECDSENSALKRGRCLLTDKQGILEGKRCN